MNRRRVNWTSVHMCLWDYLLLVFKREGSHCPDKCSYIPCWQHPFPPRTEIFFVSQSLVKGYIVLVCWSRVGQGLHFVQFVGQRLVKGMHRDQEKVLVKNWSRKRQKSYWARIGQERENIRLFWICWSSVGYEMKWCWKVMAHFSWCLCSYHLTASYCQGICVESTWYLT